MKRGAVHMSEIDDTVHKKQNNSDVFDNIQLEDKDQIYKDLRSLLVQGDITELDLTNSVKKINFRLLGLALKDTSVRKLDLSSSEISDDDIAELAAILKETQIHTLVLSNNKISAEGAAILGAALKDTQIHTLNLSRNNISEGDITKFAKSLKDTKIHTLVLKNINIVADGAASLGAALKDTKIHTLDLSYNKIGDDVIVKFAPTLKDSKIHTLNLSSNEIGDEGAASLAATVKDTQIHSLHLSFNKIGDEGAAKLIACIPDTLLFQMSFIVNLSSQKLTSSLNAALKKNHWEKRLTPYYIASLQHMPENEVNQYYNLPYPSAKEAELKYAGGIYTALAQIGVADLQKNILSYLPSVSPTLAHQYQLATAQAANKKQALKNEHMSMDVESDTVNKTRVP